MKEVAQITGLSEHTLRFYEKQQLILNIKRDSKNYRLYSDFDIQWIQFLTKVKSTNMPLKNIKKYADKLLILENGELYDDGLVKLIKSYKDLSSFSKGMLIERAECLKEWDKMREDKRKILEENKLKK